MTDLLKKYDYAPDKVAIDHSLEIIAKNVESAMSQDVLKECLSMIDLTSLRTEDTPASIVKLVEKVNSFHDSFPGYALAHQLKLRHFQAHY